MARIIPFLLCIPILASAAQTFRFPPTHLALAEPVVREILECRFDNALRITDSAYAASADIRPIAAVLHLTALGMRDIDFDTAIDPAAFVRSFERAQAAIGRYESAHGITSYSATLRGFALGIHASYHLKNKSYRTAGVSGLDAVKAMREAKELDSTNVEANFFLGLYDYAKTELRRRLRWVLFWYPGSKEDGIRLLEEGAQGATVTRAAALLALSDIYLKENQPRRSREIVFNLKRELPQSRFVLWAEAKYYEDQKMHVHAARIYGTLADMYANEPHGARNAAATRKKQTEMQRKVR